MTKTWTLLSALLLTMCLSVLAGDGPPPDGGPPDALPIPGDTVFDTVSRQLNSFRVESARIRELGADFQPLGNTYDMLMVHADDLLRVNVETARHGVRGAGVGIFHAASGAPMLTAADTSGDGRLDLLVYTVLDPDGRPQLELVDYYMDGQPNLRVNLDSGSAELWHVDRWYRVESRDGVRGIWTDGEFLETRIEDGRLLVAPERRTGESVD